MISHKFLPITPFAFTKLEPHPVVRAQFYEVKYNEFMRQKAQKRQNVAKKRTLSLAEFTALCVTY
jgi:hypothetical protein